MDNSTSASPAMLDGTDPDRGQSPTIHRSQLALLRYRVAALETMLAVERQRRQAVIDRYERLLEEQ